ncbi:hypothetical protein F4819DRAFT_483474 [Hypoxylon fuscum]|nr:hypothetical protein F4819DRAFT_483474 [Hypoxylon fuscum]
MPVEQTSFHNDSNWTFMYVILGLIPVLFVAVAMYSVWRDRSILRQNDFEMAVFDQTCQRSRFPWREAIAASERRGHSPYTVHPAQAKTKSSVSPLSIGRQTRGSGKSQGGSQDFEDVPL